MSFDPLIAPTAEEIEAALVSVREAEDGDGGEPAVGLDDLGPSLARVAGFEIPHPEVRSGEALAGARLTGREYSMAVTGCQSYG